MTDSLNELRETCNAFRVGEQRALDELQKARERIAELEADRLRYQQERDHYRRLALRADRPEQAPCPECERRSEMWRRVDKLAQRVLAEPQNRGPEQAAQGAPGWVPVASGNMPAPYEVVQFVTGPGNGKFPWDRRVGARTNGPHWIWTDVIALDQHGEGDIFTDDQVTYWAPMLPDPPADTTKPEEPR